MHVIFARESIPEELTVPSIFLAGPSPRSKDVQSWRPEALRLLEERGFDGLVFVPEGREWVPQVDYDAQIEWEADGLERSSCILFWIPRRLPDMPGFTTNDEFGQWKTSGKVVLGAPPEAVKVNYQRWWAKRLDIPTSDSLEDTVKKAIGKAHHSFRIQQDLTRVWVDHTQ